MKIQRFNENIDFDYESTNVKFSKKLSYEVNEYIDNFDSSVDFTIMDWYDTIISELKQKPIFASDKKSIEFAKSKNLKSLEKYLTIDSEIDKLDKKIETLEISKKIYYTEGSSELLYWFQEDLLKNNKNIFIKLFMEENNNMESVENFSDIHPDIIKKYKKDIELILNSKKYNL